MPMNLDAVGAVSEPGPQRRGRRRTRCSTRSASAPARPTRPVSSSSSRPRTRSDTPQRVLPTMPVVISMGGGPGLPSWGEFDFRDAAARRAGRDRARPDPARRRGRVGRAHRRHLRQGQGGRGAAREQVDLRRHRQARVLRPASRAFIRGEGGFGESRGDEHRRPAEDARARARSRGHVRDPRRPGVALPAVAATATRCTPTRRSRSSRASTGRSSTACARYGFTGRALLHELCGSDVARFKSMDSRFSKPVMPGDTLTVRMWDDGKGRALYQTATQDGTVVIDGGVFTYDVASRTRRHCARAICGVLTPVRSYDRVRATLAAPMRGPSGPRLPGTIRVPREKSRRQLASSSAWAAAKNGSPKPSATEPLTTASGRSSRFATDATARPDEHAGALAHLERRVGRRPTGDRVRSRCPTPRPRGTRARRTRRGGRRARRSRGRCGRRCRASPSRRRPSSTMPPPTPVDTTIAM